MISTVVLSPRALKELRGAPQHIVKKLTAWVEAVESEGLEMVRRNPGFHDEPLKGDRKGQRSIRLSRSYRACYVILRDGSIEFVDVREVNKHDY